MILPPTTHLGAVALTVADLARSQAFYTQALGMKVLGSESGRLILGAGERPLLHLQEAAHFSPVQPQSGLYHFALLVPSRPELARVLWQFAQTQTPLQGMADHFVSEALYLGDPDGHGIEVYRDRPRTEWTYTDGPGGERLLNIGTAALDPYKLMEEVPPPSEAWEGLSPQTQLGHVHLHVGDMAAGQVFYQELLGFELIGRMGRFMSFLGAGGYHHHIAIRPGRPRRPQSLGLAWYSILLPSPDDLAALEAQLKAKAYPYEKQGGALVLHDAGANGLRIEVSGQ
jgi:catechol 2,3-dioxygenase